MQAFDRHAFLTGSTAIHKKSELLLFFQGVQTTP